MLVEITQDQLLAIRDAIKLAGMVMGDNFPTSLAKALPQELRSATKEQLEAEIEKVKKGEEVKENV